MELINILTQQLGVNTQQATGGLGLLMGAAQQKLGPNFSEIAKVLPGVEGVIQQAPKPQAVGLGASGLLGTIGGLMGGKGGALGSLGSLASLAGGFQQLGLKPDMVGKFLPVVLDFVKSKGGDAPKALLENALK